MLVKHLKDCKEIVAGDTARLRELLHPERDPVACRYSLALARLEPGRKSLPHSLEQTEVYCIVRGEGVMHVGDETARVGAGDTVYIPAGATQWLENDGEEPTEFLCIVDPAWRGEGERAFRSADGE